MRSGIETEQEHAGWVDVGIAALGAVAALAIRLGQGLFWLFVLILAGLGLVVAGVLILALGAMDAVSNGLARTIDRDR